MTIKKQKQANIVIGFFNKCKEKRKFLSSLANIHQVNVNDIKVIQQVPDGYRRYLLHLKENGYLDRSEYKKTLEYNENFRQIDDLGAHAIFLNILNEIEEMEKRFSDTVKVQITVFDGVYPVRVKAALVSYLRWKPTNIFHIEDW